MRYGNIYPLWPTAETRGHLYQPRLANYPDLDEAKARLAAIPSDVEPPSCWDLDESGKPLNIRERRVLVLGVIIGIWPGAFLTLGVELLMRML